MNKILDTLVKYGPVAFSALAALLTKQQQKQEQAEMTNAIIAGVVKGLKSK